MDLFTHLECALNFDGNPHDKLSMAIMPDNVGYDPAETPTSIGLHGTYYMVLFQSSKCVWFCVCVVMCLVSNHLQVWIVRQGRMRSSYWWWSSMLAKSTRRSM